MITKNVSISNMRKKAIEGARIKEVIADEKENIRKQVADNRLTEIVARERIEKLDREVINGVHEVKKEITKTKEGYIELLRKSYEPAGDKVHEDVKLLESGYPLTREELEGLRNKHLANMVMLKVFERYSKDNNIHFKEVPTIEKRIEALNSIEGMLFNLVDDPTSYMARLVVSDSAWEKAISGYSGLIGDGTNIL